MLVLSRKQGEGIAIGPDVELVVISLGRGRVKLGFKGPRELPIVRRELLERAAEVAEGPEP